jgi:hypothetical protein
MDVWMDGVIWNHSLNHNKLKKGTDCMENRENAVASVCWEAWSTNKEDESGDD